MRASAFVVKDADWACQANCGSAALSRCHLRHAQSFLQSSRNLISFQYGLSRDHQYIAILELADRASIISIFAMSAHDPGGDSVYTYEPLPNHNNTRLLHLQPGLPGEPLYGSLAISDLYDCGGTYEAISYAWGNSVKPQYISLDDRRLAITESLFTALQRFRSARSVRVLWADAVCIDQANEGERSLQVNRMGQIYRGAASVLVWLGHEDEAHVQAVLRGICEFLEDGAERHDYYWHESQVQTFEGERVLFDPNKGEIDGLLSVCACNWLADLNTRIVRETCTDFVRQSLGSVEAG